MLTKRVLRIEKSKFTQTEKSKKGKVQKYFKHISAFGGNATSPAAKKKLCKVASVKEY